ncbi:hypothetical protein C1Y08_18705 [Pseudomonas sp. FW306-02-F02-AA]|nr:hypothetical protein C1Y07_17035 [Pseudomonas sp. FW306-02-F02-AB]PMZ11872.1 hypothetical protein C1Y06_00185 [Pseudomonas sp. FW306-02-H06C]PMZ14452.1 hypothetical protein C1Y08_18705 [Pseudomonas sp. FW306-02-F02-AA]PMZ20493.1 hypothetical protein C1Y09_18810 [Pseudomonas sp. FW306-02-F08-AA]PMZ26795.1 hypothetical protein C1Y05_15965 [Pseudomonas sp. FW306-02-F04-BA]PMZ34384.1 hypothetical protein C1X99_11945 [Pseudomonas sp. FW306-02-H06B]PMZ38833.1 hypothetical protein C1Y00_20040 [Ps
METPARFDEAFLWRGGLPPLGCEADPGPESPFFRHTACADFTTATQPGGGKPPRHKKLHQLQVAVIRHIPNGWFHGSMRIH